MNEPDRIALDPEFRYKVAHGYRTRDFLNSPGWKWSYDSTKRVVSKVRHELILQVTNEDISRPVCHNADSRPSEARTGDLEPDRSPEPCPPQNYANLGSYEEVPRFSQPHSVQSDKKVGSLDWRQWCRKSTEMQELAKEASWSQDTATFDFGPRDNPVAIIVLGDWHWGSWATDYNLIESLTDEILSLPDLYVIVAGDMEHMAIKLRGVTEVTDNMWRPKDQHAFTESWLEEIGQRILCACWDNHSVMREEAGSGDSQYRKIMSRKVVYHNGIGHVDIAVGDQMYKLAVTHRFQGSSVVWPVYGQVRYMRQEGIDREIAVAADTHKPGFLKYTDGATTRLAINCGSVQTESGYARRHFSLTTHPTMPVFTLHPSRHDFTPYWSVAEWLDK